MYEVHQAEAMEDGAGGIMWAKNPRILLLRTLLVWKIMLHL